MAKKRYISGSPVITDDDAEIIGKFIETNFGDEVTPDQLLEAARPRNSPIHRFFDWDDSSAAEKYRRQQARKLIVSVCIEYEKTPMRTYHNVTIDKEPKFASNDRIKDAPDLYQQVIENSLKMRKEFAYLNFPQRGASQ